MFNDFKLLAFDATKQKILRLKDIFDRLNLSSLEERLLAIGGVGEVNTNLSFEATEEILLPPDLIIEDITYQAYKPVPIPGYEINYTKFIFTIKNIGDGDYYGNLIVKALLSPIPTLYFTPKYLTGAMYRNPFWILGQSNLMGGIIPPIKSQESVELYLILYYQQFPGEELYSGGTLSLSIEYPMYSSSYNFFSKSLAESSTTNNSRNINFFNTSATTLSSQPPQIIWLEDLVMRALDAPPYTNLPGTDWIFYLNTGSESTIIPFPNTPVIINWELSLLETNEILLSGSENCLINWWRNSFNLANFKSKSTGIEKWVKFKAELISPLNVLPEMYPEGKTATCYGTMLF